MSKKEKEPKIVRLGAYDLDKYVPEYGSGTMKKDPLDEVMENRAKMLASRAKELQAKAYITQLEKEVADAGGGSTTGNQSAQAFINNLMSNPELQKKWLEYDDGQRAVLTATITALGSSQGGKSGGMDALLPILFMRMNQNPTSSTKDLIELVKMVTGERKPNDEGKNIVESIRLGFDMATKNNPQGSGQGVLKEAAELLKPLYEGLSSKDREMYDRQFEYLKSQISSPREMMKEISDSAEVLGFRRGDANIDWEREKLGIEKWKIEESWKREDRLTELGLKAKSDERRDKMMSNLGTKFMKEFSPIINATIEDAKTKLTKETKSTANMEAPPLRSEFHCTTPDCGEVFTVEGTPDSITCPKCKMVYGKNV